jgi:arylsulfatase A-like enzyme
MRSTTTRCGFIADHARDHSEQPFFMYVAHTAPHWPMHAKPADIEKYRGKYDAGYDAIRAARLERMRAMGLIDPHWETRPQRGGAWDAVEDREFELRCMEVYAAMIDCLDQGIGRILDELRRTGQFDRTLIMFFQDNGGCAEGMGRRRRRDPTARRRSDPASVARRLPAAGHDSQADARRVPDAAGIRRSAGRGGHLPRLRRGMGERQQHALPRIQALGARRRDLVAADRPLARRRRKPVDREPTKFGRLVHDPAHLIDLMPTCVDVGRGRVSANAPRAGHLADGRRQPAARLRPAKPLQREQPIFFEHEGNRAVRDGRWKLVAKGPAGAWELYDMATDRTEMNDLAAQQPERVRAMVGQWEAWAKPG